MAIKLFILVSLVTVATAQHSHYKHAPNHIESEYNAPEPIHHSTPVHLIKKHHEEEAPAKYDFEYSVHDIETGDIKQQHEVRNGRNVQGSYSLVDADGLHRVVEYTADEHNGFQATVRREHLSKPFELSHKTSYVHHYAPVPVVHNVPTHNTHQTPENYV